jgi:hypothetical protein
MIVGFKTSLCNILTCRSLTIFISLSLLSLSATVLIPANTRQGVPPPGWQAYIVCLVGLPPDMVDGGSNVFLLVRCNILYLGYWVVAWHASKVRLLLWDYHTLYQQFGYGNSVAVALFI